MTSILDQRSEKERRHVEREDPTHNAQGGISLVEDGTGRLRNKRKSDFHDPNCECVHHRAVCCLHCHLATKSTKIFPGTPGFAAHVKRLHPHAYAFDPHKRLAQNVTRHLQERQLTRELAKQENLGLRRVPIRRITPEVVKALHLQVQLARSDIRARKQDPLFLAAIEQADSRMRPNLKRDLERQVRTLIFEVERSNETGTPVTVKRDTHYDPRIAAEILKLEYGLGRSWSFIVHLLCVYGINTLVNDLATKGITPPDYIPSVPNPRDILKDEALNATRDGIFGSNLRGAAKTAHERANAQRRENETRSS